MPSMGGSGRYGGDDVSGGSRGGSGNGGSQADPRVSRFSPAMQEAILRGGHTYAGMLLGENNVGDLDMHYKRLRRSQLESKWQNEANTRLANEKDMAAQVANASMSWADRVKANNAAKAGQLGMLDDYGFNTKKMRESHNAGGFLGNLLDWDTDDVQTMAETKAKVGNSSMGEEALGWMAKNYAGGVGGWLARTTDPKVGVVGKEVLSETGDRLGPKTSKTARQAASLASFMGYGTPALGPALGMYGMLNSAADRQYAGMLSSNPTYSDLSPSEYGRAPSGYLDFLGWLNKLNKAKV